MEADPAEALAEAGTPVAVAAAWAEHAEGRQTLVFTAGVALAYETAEAPTLSPLGYAQVVGRGTRLAPGKADCLVVDLAGATEAHSLARLGVAEPPSVKSLVGLEIADGESVLATYARRQAPA